MQFRLLGSTDVRNAGYRIDITAGRQRILLAALLLRANQAVPAAELADALWGESMPASAQASVQNYVRRLRHALGDAAHERIRTITPGYEIVVQPDELDVTAFERLLQAGRAAAREAAWPQAAVLLRDALRQWRGEPLADLPRRGMIKVEAQRLSDLRMLAIETRVTADLHLGRQAPLIAELRYLVGQHPLRERLHGLLMLALWLDGQRAAAMLAYRQARGILRGKLGIELSGGLQALHDLMLRGGGGPLAPAAPGEGADLARALLELAPGAGGRQPGGGPLRERAWLS